MQSNGSAFWGVSDQPGSALYGQTGERLGWTGSGNEIPGEARSAPGVSAGVARRTHLTQPDSGARHSVGFVGDGADRRPPLRAPRAVAQRRGGAGDRGRGADALGHDPDPLLRRSGAQPDRTSVRGAVAVRGAAGACARAGARAWFAFLP